MESIFALAAICAFVLVVMFLWRVLTSIRSSNRYGGASTDAPIDPWLHGGIWSSGGSGSSSGGEAGCDAGNCGDAGGGGGCDGGGGGGGGDGGGCG